MLNSSHTNSTPDNLLRYLLHHRLPSSPGEAHRNHRDQMSKAPVKMSGAYLDLNVDFDHLKPVRPPTDGKREFVPPSAVPTLLLINISIRRVEVVGGQHYGLEVGRSSK